MDVEEAALAALRKRAARFAVADEARDRELGLLKAAVFDAGRVRVGDRKISRSLIIEVSRLSRPTVYKILGESLRNL